MAHEQRRKGTYDVQFIGKWGIFASLRKKKAASGKNPDTASLFVTVQSRLNGNAT